MFAVRIIRLVDKLPNTSAGRAIGNQIVRSGTSPGANYRAACVGKSDVTIQRMPAQFLFVMVISIMSLV